MEKGTKKITAKAVVTDVQNYVKLSDEEITKTIEDNNSKLQLTDKQKERWHKKCLCLEDVVVGTSIPYNYEKSRF